MTTLCKEKQPLNVAYPELAKEWDYDKNAPLTPSDITKGSRRSVWWIGKCGHSWDMPVCARTIDGQNCPYCSGRRVLKGFNDLQSVNPELSKEWNYSRNGELLPSEVTAKSKKIVWWKGKCGHEWESDVISRAYGHGCPYCKGKKVITGINDLQALKPELISEWDYEKNDGISPDEIALNSHIKVWWKGVCGHQWKASVSSRSRGRGCPICAKEQMSSFPEQAIMYYLKQVFPDARNNDRHLGVELDIYIPSQSVAVEYDGIAWHRDINRDLRKNAICKDNNIRLIRIREAGLCTFDDCECIQRTDSHTDGSLDDAINSLLNFIDKEHHIKANVDADRIDIFSQYIKRKRDNSLLVTNPNVAKEWHDYKNGSLTPLMVTKGSNKKVWWSCKRCGYEWQAVIANRTSEHGCPMCARERVGRKAGETRISQRGSLLEMMPQLAEEWHPTKNGDLAPSMVTVSSQKKVWWLGNCGHEWKATINDRSHDHGCPYCAGRKVLVGSNDLRAKNPVLAEEWHPTKNGDLVPGMVAVNSQKKVWWLGKCGHEWEATVGSRNRGNGCPYCAGQKVLIGFNDLRTKNPVLAEEWHPTKNGALQPENYTRNSHKKIWWLGKCGHEWEATIKNRTYNSRCPFCFGGMPKSVVCIETGKEYISVAEAAKQTGATKIIECCKGRRKTSGGYHWRYAE